MSVVAGSSAPSAVRGAVVAGGLRPRWWGPERGGCGLALGSWWWMRGEARLPSGYIIYRPVLSSVPVAGLW